MTEYAALVAVVTDILIGHRAARFTAILNECTGDGRHDGTTTATIALDHAVWTISPFHTIAQLLSWRHWRRWRNEFKHPAILRSKQLFVLPFQVIQRQYIPARISEAIHLDLLVAEQIRPCWPEDIVLHTIRLVTQPVREA